MIQIRSEDEKSEQILIGPSKRPSIGFRRQSDTTPVSESDMKEIDGILFTMNKNSENVWQTNQGKNFKATEFRKIRSDPVLNKRRPRQNYSKKEFRKILESDNSDQILKMKQQGRNNIQISDSLNLSTVQIRNVIYRKERNRIRFMSGSTDRRRKFNSVLISKLREYLKFPSNQIKTMSQIRTDFYNNNRNSFGNAQNPCLSSYWKVITSKKILNCSRKRLGLLGSYKTENLQLRAQRLKHAKRIAYFTDQKYEIIYLDESGFNVNFQPSYGYSVRNRKPRLPARSKKSVNYTLLAAVSKDRILGYNINKKSVQGVDFFQFLARIFQEYDLQSRKVLILFDNANIHKKKEYWPQFRKCLNLGLLPPYSPQVI